VAEHVRDLLLDQVLDDEVAASDLRHVLAPFVRLGPTIRRFPGSPPSRGLPPRLASAGSRTTASATGPETGGRSRHRRSPPPARRCRRGRRSPPSTSPVRRCRRSEHPTAPSALRG